MERWRPTRSAAASGHGTLKGSKSGPIIGRGPWDPAELCPQVSWLRFFVHVKAVEWLLAVPGGQFAL